MPETLEAPPVTESLGWRAGLPDDLKQNEAFVPYKTVGEFAKNYLEVSNKAKDLEGKLGDYVPKLPDNATDEDRNLYFDALGRPKQPSEYELDGEDKNAPEWNQWSKGLLHSAGLTKAQAKIVAAGWNQKFQGMVEAHNAAIKAEVSASEAKLRSEYGAKFDTNVELAKRLYQKYGEGEFDKAFDAGTSANRYSIIKMLVKFASVTGEDKSPQGGNSRTEPKGTSFINYDKSPEPPKKN
jgi:hypothetical protein